MQRDQQRHASQRQCRADPHQPQDRDQATIAVSLHFAEGLPLQQPTPAQHHAPQRAEDCIQAVQGLVWQPGDRQQHAHPRPAQRLQPHGQVLGQEHVVRFCTQLAQGRQQGWQQQHHGHADRPGDRRAQQDPARHEQEHQRRGHQAATQVVEYLPARQGRQRVTLAPVAVPRNPGHQPGQQLPVSADPAMAAADVGGIGGGIFLVHLNIGQQARARVTALDQVMAEDGVVREARGHRALEGIHLVDALADERSLAEYILVYVGNRARVGVDAGIAAEQSRIVRARRAGQADADARLQDAVANHDQAPGAALRAIERMFHRADEFRGGFPGQLGIGIQGDDVTGALQGGDVAHDVREALPGVAAQ